MDKKKIIFLSAVVLITAAVFIPGYLKILKLKKQNRQLETQIDEIRQANRKLEDEQERLINDPIYLEEVARRKLGVVRKGEVVYKVLPR